VLGRTRLSSRRLAAAVCGTLKEELQTRCTVKSARFAVLREARMSSVLVEVGYVSNRAESGRLSREAYRRAAARAIARGIVSYVRALGTQHI
jgi:N-acetylmuramoyl-L-alanine amidase